MLLDRTLTVVEYQFSFARSTVCPASASAIASGQECVLEHRKEAEYAHVATCLPFPPLELDTAPIAACHSHPGKAQSCI